LGIGDASKTGKESPNGDLPKKTDRAYLFLDCPFDQSFLIR